MKEYLHLPALLACALAFPAQAEKTHMTSRDLKCHDYQERAQAICQRISKEMEWTWTGHAIVSPGWRVTFTTARNTYCKEHIGPQDIGALMSLSRSKDWRLQQGAAQLLALLKTRPGAEKDKLPESAYDPHNGEVIGTDENSVFNPKNPQYVLRGGCKP